MFVNDALWYDNILDGKELSAFHKSSNVNNGTIEIVCGLSEVKHFGFRFPGQGVRSLLEFNTHPAFKSSEWN